MWLAGGVDRAKWFGFKFVEGQIIEGALRDNDGRAQGTMLLEVLKPLTTDEKGHWVKGRYLVASDTHMRWWMESGQGKGLSRSCSYHFCETTSIDCKATKKGAAIHLEKFRVIGQRQINSQVPDWAFKRPCAKIFLDYLKGVGKEPGAEVETGELPWAEPGEDEEDEEESEEESSSGSGGEAGLKAKLEKARADLDALEKQLRKAAQSKSSKSHAKEKVKQKSPSRKEEKPKKAVKEKTKKRPAKEKEKGNEKKKRDRSPDREAKKKEEKERKAKKKRIDEPSSSSSEEEEEGLFGAAPVESRADKGPKLKKDRGPFGGGDVVRYQGETDSESEQGFRDAPAAPKASNQLRLVQYSKKTPGRLASRLLIKMQQEGALGAVGAGVDETGEMTPPAATHYLMTVMIPQLGNKLNLRSQRELKTLCAALDLLAKKQPAHAADLLGQRVKALEKASHDGSWTAAQFLELLSPEAGGLLERDEEVYMNREALLELKLKGLNQPRGRGGDNRNPQEKGGKKGKEKGKGKGNTKEKDKTE